MCNRISQLAFRVYIEGIWSVGDAKLGMFLAPGDNRSNFLAAAQELLTSAHTPSGIVNNWWGTALSLRLLYSLSGIVDHDCSIDYIYNRVSHPAFRVCIEGFWSVRDAKLGKLIAPGEIRSHFLAVAQEKRKSARTSSRLGDNPCLSAMVVEYNRGRLWKTQYLVHAWLAACYLHVVQKQQDSYVDYIHFVYGRIIFFVERNPIFVNSPHDYAGTKQPACTEAWATFLLERFFRHHARLFQTSLYSFITIQRAHNPSASGTMRFVLRTSTTTSFSSVPNPRPHLLSSIGK